jgi:adenosylcobinamide-phosphate guanylyltransferase
MIGLVMAGGKGTRMNLDNEKLLLKYKKSIILHVTDSLKDSNCFSKILALTSSNSPKTKKLLQENNIEIFNTNGIGYVEDLTLVLQSTNDSVLVTSGDLPLLDKEIIKKIVKHYDPEKIWTSILVTNKFLTKLGLQSDYSIDFSNQTCHYTGISLINSNKINSSKNLDENYIIIDDKRIAFNLNTKQDYELLGTT